MSERRRTKYDIYADSIEVIAKKGMCSLTRISYGANMPVDRAKKTLDFLVSHGFIREVIAGDRKKFRATKWGLEYLETYKRMQKFFAALKEPAPPSTRDVSQVVLPGRVATGYRELDSLLLGGLPKNFGVVLTSPSCDERDVLVRKFLETGAKEGQTTFFVTSEAGGVADLAQKYQENFYLIICNPQADKIVQTLPNTVKLKGVENLTEIGIALTSVFRKLTSSASDVKRACIDIVSDVLLQHHAVNTRRWLAGLLPQLKSRGFTTLGVVNPQMHFPPEVHAILGLFEGEITIYEREGERGTEKFLAIKKMANQKYLESQLPLKKKRLQI